MSTAVAEPSLQAAACFLWHQAWAGEGGTGSVISLGVLLTMVSGLQGGRPSGPPAGAKGQEAGTEWGH